MLSFIETRNLLKQNPIDADSFHQSFISNNCNNCPDNTDDFLDWFFLDSDFYVLQGYIPFDGPNHSSHPVITINEISYALVLVVQNSPEEFTLSINGFHKDFSSLDEVTSFIDNPDNLLGL